MSFWIRHKADWSFIYHDKANRRELRFDVALTCPSRKKSALYISNGDDQAPQILIVLSMRRKRSTMIKKKKREREREREKYGTEYDSRKHPEYKTIARSA